MTTWYYVYVKYQVCSLLREIGSKAAKYIILECSQFLAIIIFHFIHIILLS